MLTSICRSIVTICSGLYLCRGMTRFPSKWILSHSTWYKFLRSGHPRSRRFCETWEMGSLFSKFLDQCDRPYPRSSKGGETWGTRLLQRKNWRGGRRWPPEYFVSTMRLLLSKSFRRSDLAPENGTT